MTIGLKDAALLHLELMRDALEEDFVLKDASPYNVQWRGADPDEDFVRFVETCVQCRGCEPACPSGVPFGSLMESTRATLADQRRITPWWQRLGFRVLPHHRLLLAGSTALAVAQRMRLVPKRLGLAGLPVRRPRVTPV